MQGYRHSLRGPSALFDTLSRFVIAHPNANGDPTAVARVQPYFPRSARLIIPGPRNRHMFSHHAAGSFSYPVRAFAFPRASQRNQLLLDKIMMLLPKNFPAMQWRRLPPYSRISASSPTSQSRRPLRLFGNVYDETRDKVSGSCANASLLN